MKPAVIASLLGCILLLACGEPAPAARPAGDAATAADCHGLAAGADATAPTGGSTSPPLPVATPWHPAGQVPEGCQPLAFEGDCLGPLPSDWFREGTGRLRYPAAVLPRRPGDDPQSPGPVIDLLAMFPQDGAPILPQIAVRLAGGVDPKPLLPAYVHGQLNPDLSASLQLTSPTLLLDAATAQPVPHFAEVDPRAEVPAERMLILRPVVPLRPGHRYVAVLRQGLVDLQGQVIAAPSLFAALRDGLPLPATVTPASGEVLRQHFEADVFAVTQQAGLVRKDLLLAWDFTTRSDASATGDLLSVRSQLLAALSQAPPQWGITQVIDNERPSLARRVEGWLQVPLFVDGEGPGARLLRDGSLQPRSQGMVKVPFTLLIPPKVWLAKSLPPARVVQYGHGFFGSRKEAWDGILPELLERGGMVGMAVDWWGMSTPDAGTLVQDLIFQPDQGLRFVERVHQGMANQLALTWASRGGLWQAAALKPPRGAVTDGQVVAFYGISQGHILGGTMVALNPWIDKAILGVGGAGFGLMMSRAAPFEPFLALLEGATGSRAGATRMTLFMAGPLERIDPISYAAHLRRDTYPGSPAAREVLMHCGLADTQVPNLANHVHARALGLPLLQPAPRQVYGLASAPYPATSGLVEFDFGLQALDVTAEPSPTLTPVHETVRTLDASLQQIERFLRPCGQIEQTCSGVCDPQ